MHRPQNPVLAALIVYVVAKYGPLYPEEVDGYLDKLTLQEGIEALQDEIRRLDELARAAEQAA